jgi:hypothetical protein
MAAPGETRSEGHHYIPQFMLRGFAGPNGRLTVARLCPTPKVWTEVRPRYVGRADHLNSFERDDGSLDNVLEREPLNRLDTVGADALRQVIEYARQVEPTGMFKLWNRAWEERVPFTMYVAGLLVRGPGLREHLDDAALPALIEHLRDGIRLQDERGQVDPLVAKTLLDVFERPGGIRLSPPRNRHQYALLGLITTMTGAIGSPHIVAVRRVSEPLLTGSEPVVILPSGDVREAVPLARFLREARPPVALWEEQEVVHARLMEIMGDAAGLALAVDRHTVVVFLNAEKKPEESGKLAFLFSQLPANGISELLNLNVVKHSRWVAGAAGDPLLELIVAGMPTSALPHTLRRKRSPSGG